MKHGDALVVVPAKNEAARIGGVVARSRELGFSVLVVSDGSVDDTVSVARKFGAAVLENDASEGLSVSVGRGVAYARDNAYKAVITIDGDGQHDPETLGDFFEALCSHKIVLGTRFGGLTRGIPTQKLAGNSLGANLVSQITGQRCLDPSCGMRGFHISRYREFWTAASSYEYVFNTLFDALGSPNEMAWCHVPAIYHPNVPMFTRSAEILALISAAVQSAGRWSSFLKTIKDKVTSGKHFKVSVGGDEYFCFYLFGYDGYLIQCEWSLCQFEFTVSRDRCVLVSEMKLEEK